MDLKEQREWLRRVLGQGGGFASYLEHECGTDVTFEMGSVEREEQAIDILERACAFVFRCLANPRCEGSDEVIRDMMEARARNARKEPG